MKLNALKAVIKKAEKFCKDNGIPEDIACVVDMDDNGYYTLESVDIKQTEEGDLVLNFKSSNEV